MTSLSTHFPKLETLSVILNFFSLLQSFPITQPLCRHSSNIVNSISNITQELIFYSLSIMFELYFRPSSSPAEDSKKNDLFTSLPSTSTHHYHETFLLKILITLLHVSWLKKFFWLFDTYRIKYKLFNLTCKVLHSSSPNCFFSFCILPQHN